MRLPSLLNYQLALQDPRTAFHNVDELRTGTTVLNAQAMPSVASGGFAATFAVETAGAQRFAVRCFHKQGHDDRRLRERYDHIHRFVRAHPLLRFLTDAVYQDNGIVVQGTAYPMVRMRWAAGEMLGVWVEDWIEDPRRDPSAIDTVRAAIAEAVAALRTAGAAHGDLQHGNIVVGDDLSITLIDYDGMYLDSFRGTGLQAIEQGHRNYQHPGRGAGFDSGIDTFAAAVIDLSLHALQQRPTLWDDFGGTGENLIFTARDFVDPDNSPVFSALALIPAVARAAERLRRACRTDYGYIEAVLAGRTTAAPVAGRFTLVTGEIIAAAARPELLDREGETITVHGRVGFATMVIGRQGRDVALINLGDYRQGDFTIVAYDDVARKLFADYGNTDKFGNRRLRRLHGWRVAITGTVVIFDNKGMHVPQIELVRAGLLRNLTEGQLAALTAPPPTLTSASAPSLAPPPAPRMPASAPPSGKPAAAQPDRTRDLARRQARLSDMYKNHQAAPPPLPSPATTPTPAKPPSGRASSPPTISPRAGIPTETGRLPAAPTRPPATLGPRPMPPPTYPVVANRPATPPTGGYRPPNPPTSRPREHRSHAARSSRRVLVVALLAIVAMLVLVVLMGCAAPSPRLVEPTARPTPATGTWP